MDNGTAEAIATGGTLPYKYAWSSGTTTRLINNSPPTHLSVTVTDSNGCAASQYGVTIVASKGITASLGADIDLCPGDSIQLRPGNYFSYRWQDGSSLPIYAATHAGHYTVSVTNDTGCIAIASVKINPLCQDILFPGGFTPNNDRRNDGFGPLGTLSAVREYSIQIFDRWGKPVFASANPYDKWNGKINNDPAPGGTYVWIAKYSFNGKTGLMKRGTIVLMR